LPAFPPALHRNSLRGFPITLCAQAAGLLERIFAVPNPKRRHSKARSSKRRSHDFLTATGVSECPNCHERKLPHHACAKCGTYKGRNVLEVKEAS
jgi:large subunit ribosomal protein L32